MEKIGNFLALLFVIRLTTYGLERIQLSYFIFKLKKKSDDEKIAKFSRYTFHNIG